ncbi:MAG: ATP-binding protein [Flavobacteriales bacterium]|nr:ATP-binding protein [Flavobacteriales bacterium]MBK9698814.1 ATP-binding protein [Flavobacteriales bacterium]
MGYEFATAVADLVDNCIEAGANQVDIQAEWDGDSSWVSIADNGSGMSPAILKEAMRYGSERDYSEDDLGKFGLGMKTASMSQCRRLTVSSQTKGAGSITSYSWDLAHIGKTNRWEILPIAQSELPWTTKDKFKEGFRTVVRWDELDRILGYKHPYGESARKQLAQMCSEIETHLSMVFHRFLSGEAAKPRVRISLNGNPLEPWDPFCRKEKTQRLDRCSIPVEYNDATGKVIFDPYVLPHQHRFSSTDAHERASGPNKWNRQQGFYIYRSDRLIQSGGWSDLRTLDEHSKLARIALRFDPKLDEAFKINVAKMRVQLPASIRGDLVKALAPVLRAADTEYRKGGGTKPGGKPMPSPKSDVPAPEQNGKSKSNAANNIERLFTLDEAFEKLLSVASKREQLLLKEVFARLRKKT